MAKSLKSDTFLLLLAFSLVAPVIFVSCQEYDVQALNPAELF